MKIVAINGSPRKDGNTAKLLKKFTEEHAGIDLVYYDLVDMKIKDCIACMHCKSHDACSIKDDMTKIYKDLKECDAMLFASPIYMGAETATLKAVVDRLFALLSPVEGPARYAPRLSPGKKMVALFTCGNPKGDEIYSGIMDRYYSSAAFLGISKCKVFVVGGLAPSMDVMEKAEVPKIVDEVHKFLKH